ncbi:MAG TPA: uroporphyrinogen decarboxylase [Planctomycetota bacterium]|nr:uroporphyrinogen decarboxylase [Planctomycetota bacterium]
MPESDPLLLRALRREPVSRAPVWLMRQAGRYLPEYRAVREAAGGFLQMVETPELAAEVTLQPVRRFGMDAAILFSDILVPLKAMGMELVFDERGPVLPRPLRTREDVLALEPVDPAEGLSYVGKALRLVRAGLPEHVALVGFCGAPFTLASYAVEGGTSRSHAHLRSMMYRDPETFELLAGRLTAVVARHMRYQAASGAQALVLFDTWAGSLGREDWLRFAAPWAHAVLRELEGVAPRILFAGASDHLLEDLPALGAEAVAIDHRTPIGAAFERTRGRVALQGNLDPAALLAAPDEVARRTRAILDEVGGRAGHVLNLGHGVMKETDPECVAAFVTTALEAGR